MSAAIIIIINIIIGGMTNLGSHTEFETKLRLETMCLKSQSKVGSI